MNVTLAIFKVFDVIFLFFSQLFHREKKISGCISLVTGGAQGIGRCIAKQLLGRGSVVVIVDVNKQQLDKTVDELRASGKNHVVHGYTCDVSKVAEVNRVVEQITREVGEIDLLFNNAGIIYAKPMLQTEVSDYERTIGVNLMAHFWTIKSILPQMKKRGKGMIINTASMAGVTGGPLLTAYCASKFAVVGYSEGLRYELLLENSPISVHVVMPFMIRTAMNDVYCPPAVKRNEAISDLTSPDRCAEILVSEVLRGRFKVFVPPSGSLVVALQGILPTKLMDLIASTSGMCTLDAL